MTLNINVEHALLARGDPAHTPRRRAELHGLDVQAYLHQVYGREPAPLAVHRPGRRPPGAWERREARARRVLAALAADPTASVAAIMRAADAPRGVVRHIRSGRSWQYLRLALAPECSEARP